MRSDFIGVDWPIVDEMPAGWGFDKTVGSPLTGYSVISNGKSMLSGNKRALLCVVDRQRSLELSCEPTIPLQTEKKSVAVMHPDAPRRLNELARASFMRRMLADIMADLMVCEIEGWNKREYLDEIKRLVNSVGTTDANP